MSRRTRLVQPRSRYRFSVEVTRPEPVVWKEACDAAEGDFRRLRTQPDGSVIVNNTPHKHDPNGREPR